MANKYIKTGENISCKVCKKQVYVQAYLIKSGRKKYCSKECLYKGDSYTMTFKKGHSKSFLGERVHTPETKIKIGLSSKGKHTGSLAWNWIEDRSKLKDDSKERGGQLHREWSRSVKNRDGWKCKISNGDCSGQVVAHHILPWRDYVELRYEVNNGITLCHFHHPRKRNDEMRLSPYFQELVKGE